MPRPSVRNISRLRLFQSKKGTFLLCCQTILILTSCILLTGCGPRKTENQAETPAVPDKEIVVSGKKSKTGHYRVRAAITADGLQIEELQNDAIHNVEWMKPRGEKQVAEAKNWTVFHDFQFVDRQPERGFLKCFC